MSTLQANPNKLKSQALYALARREHSRFELVQKLQKSNPDLEIINKVLDELVEKGYLDEDRFINAFIRSRSQRGYGPQRISRELQERGISQDRIENALSHGEEDWMSKAKEMRAKKFAALPQNYLERAKQMKFLQYRGFTLEQIKEAFHLDV